MHQDKSENIWMRQKMSGYVLGNVWMRQKMSGYVLGNVGKGQEMSSYVNPCLSNIT
jgi:hypothetical protein